MGNAVGKVQMPNLEELPGIACLLSSRCKLMGLAHGKGMHLSIADPEAGHSRRQFTAE
jgi:hypothetical protein